MPSQMNGCHVPVRRSHTEPGLQANWRIFSCIVGVACSGRAQRSLDGLRFLVDDCQENA